MEVAEHTNYLKDNFVKYSHQEGTMRAGAFGRRSITLGLGMT